MIKFKATLGRRWDAHNRSMFISASSKFFYFFCYHLNNRYTNRIADLPICTGNNQPFVLETPKTLKIRVGCEDGGKGALIQNNKSATLHLAQTMTKFSLSLPFMRYVQKTVTQ